MLFDLLTHRSLHFEALKEFKDLVEVKGSASGKWTGWSELVKYSELKRGSGVQNNAVET